VLIGIACETSTVVLMALWPWTAMKRSIWSQPAWMARRLLRQTSPAA
jgi:hypothetical protein